MFDKIQQVAIVRKLLKTAPYLTVATALVAAGYFGFTYLQTMRAEVASLKVQNTQIIKANEAISETMIGVKKLSETYNEKVIEIRTNTHTITNKITSKEFQEKVVTDTPEAEKELNQTINGMFESINGETK
jgi:ABC-type phosphate transport system substrate-binding protein